MSDYTPEVIEILERAERCAKHANFNDTHLNALTFATASGLVTLQHVFAVLGPSKDHKSPFRSGKDYRVLDGDHTHPIRLIIEDKGRVALAEHRMESKPGTKNRASAVEMLLRDGSKEILEIVNSKKSCDSKMREICGLDTTFLAWNSPQWAEFLDVSETAIKKTKFWRLDRNKAIEIEGGRKS